MDFDIPNAQELAKKRKRLRPKPRPTTTESAKEVEDFEQELKILRTTILAKIQPGQPYLFTFAANDPSTGEEHQKVAQILANKGYKIGIRFTQHDVWEDVPAYVFNWDRLSDISYDGNMGSICITLPDA